MSTISASEGSNLQQIDLTKLNLQQLNILKQQLDKEINVFRESIQTLKMAQGKYQESKTCLEKCSRENEGKEILVPLTESMYVPGKMADPQSVLVDIGTGYFVEKSTEHAQDYFARRIAYVTEQIEKVQSLGMEKSRILEATMDVMASKIRGQMQKEAA